MPVLAGVDVGNSTTEVVLARVDRGRVEVLGTSRAPTRGAKGSPRSLDAAAALVRRTARSAGVEPDAAVVAPLRPVTTRTTRVAQPTPATGRLRVLTAGAGTAGGSGSAVGPPHRLGAPLPPGDSRLVAVVPAGTGYRRAVADLGPLIGAGRLAAVVLEDDEAVLVANRLGAAVPVVDEVDAATALAAELLLVEVAPVGRPLRTAGDPLRVVAALGLAGTERTHAASVASRLADATNVVLALTTDGRCDEPAEVEPAWVELATGRRLALVEAAALLADSPVGAVRRFAVPPASPTATGDLWAVDLAVVAATVVSRYDGTAVRPYVLASLGLPLGDEDAAAALAQRLDVAVRLAPSEVEAARLGAATTPGSAPDTVVVDLGGGTVDVAVPGAGVVAAGAGQLLTEAVAALTGTTSAVAEWVKRGAAVRVESPQLALAEDGSRHFLERVAPSDVVGTLAVRGPAGLLPFHRAMAPGEWRALRRAAKVAVLGQNVARALRTLDVSPATVVVVGGPAHDDETVTTVSGALPAGTAVGRGDVAGRLGPRYAVAYGLLLWAASASP